MADENATQMPGVIVNSSPPLFFVMPKFKDGAAASKTREAAVNNALATLHLPDIDRMSEILAKELIEQGKFSESVRDVAGYVKDAIINDPEAYRASARALEQGLGITDEGLGGISNRIVARAEAKRAEVANGSLAVATERPAVASGAGAGVAALASSQGATDVASGGHEIHFHSKGEMRKAEHLYERFIHNHKVDLSELNGILQKHGVDRITTEKGAGMGIRLFEAMDDLRNAIGEYKDANASNLPHNGGGGKGHHHHR